MKFTAIDAITLNNMLKEDTGYIERLKVEDSALYKKIRADLLAELKALDIDVAEEIQSKITMQELCTMIMECLKIPSINLSSLRQRLHAKNRSFKLSFLEE